jgi:hypothetical protein
MKIPTQLWVGNAQVLEKQVDLFLRSHLCNSKTKDCACPACMQIKSKQHPGVIWLAPERVYVLEDIEIIFSKTSFTLEEGESVYFIVQQAHLLSGACANRLLKILEEPPAGYHFILLSPTLSAILPTIRSRSHVKIFNAQAARALEHPLLTFFIQGHFREQEFEALLKTHAPNDVESKELLDELFSYYAHELKTQTKNENDSCELIVQCLKKALKKPPQPGSATIFWKNLYLSFPRERG